jgi:hypothetical protein
MPGRWFGITVCIEIIHGEFLETRIGRSVHLSHGRNAVAWSLYIFGGPCAGLGRPGVPSGRRDFSPALQCRGLEFLHFDIQASGLVTMRPIGTPRI